MAVSGPDIHKVAWQSDVGGAQLEKILGAKSMLKPISFLEVGLQRARAVVKVVRPDGSGSGFLVGGNLLITNHHVLDSIASAKAAAVLCNYQQTVAGLDAETVRCELDPDSPSGVFLTDEADDWTVVRVKDDPTARFGALALRRKAVVLYDHVNIIQHPGGGPKQIALTNNLVVYADVDRLQYLTDTLPGSSGSPVFDDDWDVVALHHSGGLLREPGSKQIHYRNEGIAIGRVIDGLAAHGLLPA